MDENLELLPYHEVNESIHRLIYERMSSEMLFEKNIEANQLLFLDFSETDKQYTLLRRSRTKGTKVVKKFSQSVLHTCVYFVIRNLRQFEKAGIEAFWKRTEDGKMEVKFCVNLEKTAYNPGKLEEKITHLTLHKVAPIINYFLDHQPIPADFFDVQDQDHEDSDVVTILNEVERATELWEATPIIRVFENSAKPLMDYQKESVKWMIEREQFPKMDSLCNFLHCVEIFPPKDMRYPKSLFYYPSFGLFSESDTIFSTFQPKGGILADETGLGKTLEVVSLILSNQKPEEKPRKCVKCQEICDVGWRELFCSKCNPNHSLVEVKTTLIVAPAEMRNLWFNELLKYNLDVEIYTGIQYGYLDPVKIAKNDVILTSYETMEKEIHYSSKTSLTQVKWWRLVCDETQLIKNLDLFAAQMCRRINSQYRWCVTSTPIEDNISDIFGLFKLLHFKPFNIEQFWNIVVKGFHDSIHQNKDISQNLFIQLLSQIMRRTRKQTAISDMGIPRMVEIEQVVELTPIEDFRYKKEMEDLKDEVKKVIGDVQDDVVLRSVDGSEKIFEMIENLKETLIFDGEHDPDTRSKHLHEKLHTEPKNCMIRQINEKKSEINTTLSSIIEALLNVADVYHLEDNDSNAADGYLKIGDVFEMINEVNISCKELYNPEDEASEIRQMYERIMKTSRKRGPPTPRGPDYAKLQKRKRRQIEQEQEQFEEEKEVRQEFVDLRKSVALPISINDKLNIRFIPSMLEMHQMLESQVLTSTIDKMGGMVKLVASLCSTIGRFLKKERDQFQTIREKHQKVFEEYDVTKSEHVGMRDALVGMADSYKTPDSEELTTKLWESEDVRNWMQEMSFWPVFKNARKHIEDAQKRMDNTSFNSHLEQITQNYIPSNNHELVLHFVDYINRLETLRSEAFTSYTSLISYFQQKHHDPMIEFQSHSNTLLCHHRDWPKEIIIHEDQRKAKQNGILCLVCATHFSLFHLKFELGLASCLGQARECRGKLPIQGFLGHLLALEEELHPDSNFSAQFDGFVQYIERLRRNITHIEGGCSKIVKFQLSLFEMAKLARKRLTIEDLRKMDKSLPRKDDAELKMSHLNQFIGDFQNHEKNLKNLCADFRYLITLYKGSKEGSNEEEQSCPICMDEWANLNGFVGFPCGHRICQNCYPQFREQNYSQNRPIHIKCSTCRKEFQHGNVVVGREKNDEPVPGLRLTAKLMETIRIIKEILKSGKDHNIVLFTSVNMETPMGRYLINVFGNARLPFLVNDGIKPLPTGLPFEFTKSQRIVICSHHHDLMGLDFSHATHVIFLDAAKSYSSMEKAIGRVIRFGQMNVVNVYYMIVEASLDRDVFRLCRSGRRQEWLVRDVRSIFNITVNEAPRINQHHDRIIIE